MNQRPVSDVKFLCTAEEVNTVYYDLMSYM